MNENSLNIFLVVLTILSGVFTWLGYRIIKKVRKENDQIRRYKFNNRSSGGTVGYETYEKSEAHRKSEKSHGCLFGFGFILTLFSGVTFFGLIFMWVFMIYSTNKNKFRQDDPNDPLTEWRIEAEKRIEKRDSLKKVKEINKDREK